MEGITLIDIYRKQWKVDKLIGYGGFGCVYSTQCINNNTRQAVIKIESFNNNTMVLEVLVYNEIYDKDRIELWKTYKNIDHLGIPRYYGCGSFKHNTRYYRFILLERFVENTKELLKKVKKTKPLIKSIMKDMLYILEYIHEHGISHGDIKPENIMVDGKYRPYLIDYGIVSYFIVNGKHVKYYKESKNWHRGTLYYASIDAHNGTCVTRRGDLESLGYCMLKWAGIPLPWKVFGNNGNMVHAAKCDFIKRVHENKFNIKSGNKGIYDYIKYVTKLSYEEKPDYDLLRQLVNSL